MIFIVKWVSYFSKKTICPLGPGPNEWAQWARAQQGPNESPRMGPNGFLLASPALSCFLLPLPVFSCLLLEVWLPNDVGSWVGGVCNSHMVVNASV